jgi:hypothetical protein
VALVRGNAAVDERQLHIAQRVGPREEIERLEDKPDLAVADVRELVVLHCRDIVAIELVSSRGRRVEAP